MCVISLWIDSDNSLQSGHMFFTEVCVHGLMYLYSEMMFRLQHTCSHPCEYVRCIEECDIEYSKFCIIIELLERIKGTQGLDYK